MDFRSKSVVIQKSFLPITKWKLIYNQYKIYSLNLIPKEFTVKVRKAWTQHNVHWTQQQFWEKFRHAGVVNYMYKKSAYLNWPLPIGAFQGQLNKQWNKYYKWTGGRPVGYFTHVYSYIYYCVPWPQTYMSHICSKLYMLHICSF